MMLKKLEYIALPSISNDDLLILNGHPALKTLRLTSVYQEQLDFIKNNSLSFKVVEGGGYANR